MHELSLAVEIGSIAERTLGGQVTRCVAVGVDVGVQSGVEPSALEFCLESVFRQPPWRGARPVVMQQPGDVLQVSWIEVETDDGPED
jgi:Zn finger protein HypA/HybF involved in hydrogenase expression